MNNQRVHSYGIKIMIVILIGFVTPLIAARAQLRPSAEVRTIHADTFDFQVQKNGRVDILLRSGVRMIQNAEPLIWFADEDEPEAMGISGRSTMREEFKDRLGTGQSMRFVEDGNEWVIRVYPLRPYITVQAAYTNLGKKPVSVRALYPWTAGIERDGGIYLGAETRNAPVLGWPREGVVDGAPLRLGAPDENGYTWHTQLVNPATARSFLAGYLTADRALTELRFSPESDGRADGVAFETACHFDPAVTLQPGERVESEVLFLSLSDPNPFRSLERFGQAFAVSNGLHPDEHPARSFIDMTAMGLDEIRDSAGAMSERGLQEVFDGVLLADTQGFDWPLSDTARSTVVALEAMGFDTALRTTPFVAKADSGIVLDRPTWFRQEALPDGRRVRDLTAPGSELDASSYLSGLAENGISAIDLGSSGLAPLAITAVEDEVQTGPQAVQDVRRTLRAALEAEMYVMSTGAPFYAGLFSDAVRTSSETIPLSMEGPASQPWAGASALAAQSRAYYLAPFVCRPLLQTPSMQTEDQVRTWWSAASLLGATIVTPFNLAPHGDTQLSIARRCMPAMPRSARPVDLYVRDYPRVWHSAIDGPAGEWHILAVFNWNEGIQDQVRVSFSQLGLNPGNYYSIFDFWHREFMGTASNDLTASVAPGGVRVFGLRPVQDRPSVVGYDGHIAMGALTLHDTSWDGSARELTGHLLDGPGGTLHIRVPEGWMPASVSVNNENFEGFRSGTSSLAIPIEGPGPHDYRVQFTKQ